MTTGRSTPELVPYNFGASDEKTLCSEVSCFYLIRLYSSNCWGTPTDIKLLKYQLTTELLMFINALGRKFFWIEL